MRNWITIVVVLGLLIAGGLLLGRLQSGAPVSLTRGYVPQLDSTQALLLAAGVGLLLVSTIGMGATLAAMMWFGGRQIAQVQGGATRASAPARAARSAEAPAQAEAGPRARDFGPLIKAGAVAANVLVVAFIAVVTVIHFANPSREQAQPELPAPPGAQPTVAAPPPPAGPADLQGAFAALPPGDAAKGETEFKAQPCANCHSLAPDQRIIGPSLAGVATRAETRKPGYPPELYLYESIVNPGAYVVDGFQNGVMPPNFGQTLTPQQQGDIIAFLMTQK